MRNKKQTCTTGILSITDEDRRTEAIDMFDVIIESANVEGTISGDRRPQRNNLQTCMGVLTRSVKER